MHYSFFFHYFSYINMTNHKPKTKYVYPDQQHINHVILPECHAVWGKQIVQSLHTPEALKIFLYTIPFLPPLQSK